MDGQPEPDDRTSPAGAAATAHAVQPNSARAPSGSAFQPSSPPVDPVRNMKPSSEKPTNEAKTTPAAPADRGANPTLSAMAQLAGATTAMRPIMLGRAGVARSPAMTRIAV